MKLKSDKIVAVLVVVAVFVGITGFSISKSINAGDTSNAQPKSQSTEAKKKPKPTEKKSNAKKVEKPKAVDNKKTAAVSNVPVQNISLDFKASENGKLKDGVYYGSAVGFGGELKVKVTVSGNRISNIEVISHNETQAPINYFAGGAAVIQRIISAQTPNVDKITNATYTSNAIKLAVYRAIKDAYESETPHVPIPAKPEVIPQPEPNPNPSDKPENPSESTGKEDEVENKDNIFRGNVVFNGMDYDYDVIIKVEIKDGKVVEIVDKGSRDDAAKSKFAAVNTDYWQRFLDGKGLELFNGKTESEIKDVDAVSNATATTDGIKEAILKAFEQAKKTELKPKDVEDENSNNKIEKAAIELKSNLSNPNS